MLDVLKLSLFIETRSHKTRLIVHVGMQMKLQSGRKRTKLGRRVVAIAKSLPSCCVGNFSLKVVTNRQASEMYLVNPPEDPGDAVAVVKP
ncbi:MAG: hypothetical protein V2A73_19290, partial [Pseudomonadota bacterium]